MVVGKFSKGVSPLKTAACSNPKKSDKLLATRSKRKKADVEVKIEQVGGKSDGRIEHVAELEACAQKLAKRLEHSLSQVRGAKSKYLLLHNKSWILKQRLATDVSCNGNMKQRFSNTSENVLELVDTFFFANPLKSQNTVKKSFSSSFVLLIHQLQALQGVPKGPDAIFEP